MALSIGNDSASFGNYTSLPTACGNLDELFNLKWDLDLDESTVVVTCQIKEEADPSPGLRNMVTIFEVRSSKLLSDIQDELDSVTNILHQRIPPTVEVLFVTNFEEEVAL